MAGTYIHLPAAGGGGSDAWGDPVPTFGALPVPGAINGEVRMVLSTHELYYWNAVDVAWELVPTSQIDPADVADTASIDLTVTAGILSADVNLSSAGADSGYIESELSIESDGLRAQVSESLIRSLLSSGDQYIVYDDATGEFTLDTAEVLKLFSSGDAILVYNNATGVFTIDQSQIDHGSLEPSSLLDDDHPQYLLLAGRSPSQTAAGAYVFTGNVQIPRLTTAQIASIASPVGGMIVYDTDVDLPKMYIEGTYNAWVAMMGWGNP
jgi:hypothetical protein